MADTHIAPPSVLARLALSRSCPARKGVLAALAFGLVMLVGLPSASAQYRNLQFGLEGGYQFIQRDLGLDVHGPLVGLRAGYKASDHWWFTARALLSFRGDVAPQDNLVVLFHLTPVDVRYYFETDNFRPFVGGATAFHFLTNANVPSTVQWGFGPVTGVEFKLRRDLFIGFQLDGLYFIAFNGPNVFSVNATTQLIFFF